MEAEDKFEIFWSAHFHAKLMKVFGLAMGEHHRIEIEDTVKNDPPFCVMKNNYEGARVMGQR